ncbi:MAG: pyroglutamyl-peptidase I [Oscillospiraceae bacterium]|nr:pyroglutamyl-peptidase I [Oscillospiraceae bacterium]
MKILVTGFDPFGGDKINPAFEAVKLVPDKVAGTEIVKEEVPTVFGKCGVILEQLIEKHSPDAVICVGQAGGRSVMSIEKIAVNLAEARIPDNENQQPSDEPIINGGSSAYFSSLPVKAIVKTIKENGIPASISYTAGTFVCNDIMYRLLHLIETKYPKIRGGFIHVPFATEQVVDRPDGTPAMSAETIAKGLEYAIEATCKYEKDISGLAGETH